MVMKSVIRSSDKIVTKDVFNLNKDKSFFLKLLLSLYNYVVNMLCKIKFLVQFIFRIITNKLK